MISFRLYEKLNTQSAMNILVVNGSPKGKNSITLHTCLYLEKKFPLHRFSYLDAGLRIKALEKDFSPVLEAVKEAGLIVFSYPVYTFLVPSQLHRFLELLKASGIDLTGKRELAPLKMVRDNYRKVILAMSTNSTASVEGIEIIRLIDFLIE